MVGKTKYAGKNRNVFIYSMGTLLAFSKLRVWEKDTLIVSRTGIGFHRS